MFVIAALSYLLTIVAVGLFAIRVRQLIAIYKKQQPDPTRSGNRAARTKNMLKEVLGHTKMLNFTGTGIAHWFVMVANFLIGLIWIVIFYVSQTVYPISGIGAWNMIIGFSFIAVGFSLATKWR